MGMRIAVRIKGKKIETGHLTIGPGTRTLLVAPVVEMLVTMIRNVTTRMNHGSTGRAVTFAKAIKEKRIRLSSATRVFPFVTLIQTQHSTAWIDSTQNTRKGLVRIVLLANMKVWQRFAENVTIEFINDEIAVAIESTIEPTIEVTIILVRGTTGKIPM
jgi:predicted metallo-beta-lactamase superfamily hydrolase